jgi:hypothetical protein
MKAPLGHADASALTVKEHKKMRYGKSLERTPAMKTKRWQL